MAALAIGLVLMGIVHSTDGGGWAELPEPELVEAAVPEPQPDAIDVRLKCIRWHESRNDPNATNRSSKAAGPYQFLWSTWATTPQGKAGLSPYDPIAAHQAARWMIQAGRVREWVPVQRGLC